MGCLTDAFQSVKQRLVAFPYPLEVTGVSYNCMGSGSTGIAWFPSPLEVTGVSYCTLSNLGFLTMEFPSPLEVTGVSYVSTNKLTQIIRYVSVPSRGDWGVLHRLKLKDSYFGEEVSVPSRSEWGFLR